MEGLFMQVFERRDWVTGQMRQQVDSHAESLACAFLAAGPRPPPWLLPSCAAGLQELNGKPIVPGLLFAGSQITTPATNRTFFQPRAVPSISLRNVGVPNGYAGRDSICDTVDTNQHEVPQQKQVSVDQEIFEPSSEVNMFSVVKRSRSRQRHIEDRSREKGQATNSGIRDVMQDRMQRSELATAGLNKTTASLSSKPCGDGENNAGTTTTLPGQEKGFYANQDRSTEFVKCSKDGDPGNQGVKLDCSQNQIVNSDNNVMVSARSSFGVQVTGSACHALPETYLSVEPKKLQFDGVESVCMNPASEQTMQQPVCTLEGANLDLAEAHPLNEDPSSTSYSQVPQEQHLLARTSLELKETDAETPLGPTSPVTQKETLNGKAAYDAVNCHSGKLGDVQIKLSALTKACNISVSNKKDESAVPEVMSSVSARRTSEMHSTERNSMTSAEDLQPNGTEQDTSLIENAVKENVNSCTAENDKRKSPQPYVLYVLPSASHEKNILLESDRSSAACDQKRSVQDGVEVSDSMSSKRRRIRHRSDFDLSGTPCTNSLSLNHQLDISSHMLTVTNFSEKSHPSGPYFTRSSGSCKSMSLVSERGNAASDVYGNGNSSRGRRNTTSLLSGVLDNSPTASTSRSALEGRVFKNSQEQKQNKLEVEFLTTAALPYCSGILSRNEENCTQQEGTCFEGQNLIVTAASVADQEMAPEMDDLSSPIAILHQENYSGTELFTRFPSCEQASAPNALFHEKSWYDSNECVRKYKSYDPKAQLGDESFDCDGSMPVMEIFDVSDQLDSPIIGKRPFESLHDSHQLGTICSDPPNKHNTNTASSLHPLLTTTMPGKPRNCSLSDDLQYSASNSRSGMDSFGCGLESFFISDGVASCSSNASSRQEINETPLTPSVEKYSQKLSLRSGSGSEHMSSIPELEVFRIDEDNSIPEEDEYQDMAPGSVDVNCSCQRQSGGTALQDITGLCQNNGSSPSHSMRSMDKGNIDLSAESVSSELTHHSNIRNHSIKPRYNHPTSVKREGKVSRSLHDRSGTKEITKSRSGRHRSEANIDKQGTTEIINSRNGRHRSEANVDKQGTAELLNSKNGRHRSEANVDRQSKPINIVANVASFVPLVKQKLQSTTVCVKKDVKVKALKAAEAAKRLEEKKQKEQEKRKAAAKAERERLKQEKEQIQKLEEEQKKRREVDAAAKKRQREEGEKRETMKRRKCMDEARKQQKQPMDRQRVMKDEKDARQKASDNMAPRKNLVDVGKNQVKPDETTEHALRYKANESKDEKGVAVDDRNASFGSDAKENILNSFEESYTMTPYKDSDDEDDDDYDEHVQEARRRRKFVPCWARKENLDNILLSNKALNPRENFAQKLSFNISEVLSAHVLQRVVR
ncbi:hypothetical protein VPH35_022050 [Triticum aestivum]|uniref:uncharacterized protein n=1 Tax=Triticum aestivum TaxID=4565 RepID=UPI000843AB9B|nr:uncharacterized protein LOC123189552 [Triticum aestivum]